MEQVQSTHNADTHWFQVLKEMVDSGDVLKMGPYATTIYLVLKAHTNFSTGNSCPSIETIVEKSGISKRKVISELVTLENLGYLLKTKTVGNKNEYKLREKLNIKDEHGTPVAVATWDYIPASFKRAISDLKNVLITGDFAGAKIINIELLYVNLNNANDHNIFFNINDLQKLPKEMRELLLSIRENMPKK